MYKLPPNVPDPTQPSSAISGVPGPADWQPGQVPQNTTPISLLPQGNPPNGSEWVPLIQSGVTVRLPLNQMVGPPGPAGPPGAAGLSVLSLYYVATQGQTVFPLSANDSLGHSTTLASNASVFVYAGGNRLTPSGYTVNTSADQITLTYPAGAGETVVFDILTPLPSSRQEQRYV